MSTSQNSGVQRVLSVAAKLLHERGSYRLFTFLECQIVVQVASLCLQYYLWGLYVHTLRSKLYFILSVTNLAVLMVRYLSNYDSGSRKLGHLSTVLQISRFMIFQVLPVIILPFLKQITYPGLVKIVMLFALSSVLEISALTQRNIGRKLAPKTLMTDTHFRYLRSPDTLGTIGRSLALILMVPNFHVYMATFTINGLILLAQLTHRDQCLSKKPGYEKYAAKTNALVPRFFAANGLNYALAVAVFVIMLVPF